MTFNEAYNETKKLSEDYEISSFAATNKQDVQGLQKLVGKKVVRRKIKNPVTYIGSIKI